MQSALAAAAAGTLLVVTVGGDGTVHEVVNGLFCATPDHRPRCELGIVNCGTGSGLADSLGLPRTLEDQLDLLTLPHGVIIDVGRVAYRDATGRAAERWFASECQLGIGSAVNGALGFPAKRFGGRIAFGAAALQSALRHRASSLDVSYNGTGPVTLPLLGLAIGNGHICAGGMRLTPGARLDDGVFDVLAIHDMRLPTRLVNFPRIYGGSHVPSPHFSVHRTSRLRITAEPPVPVSADGECLGFTPCRISLMPAALRIRSGRSHGS
jgi:diacylglycerol kinase family enzyme